MFCDVLSSFLETVEECTWAPGTVDELAFSTEEHKDSVRSEGDPKRVGPALSTGNWTGLCDISIGYWLRSTALWAPSPSRLHSVTPSFQLLICGTLDLNILPYTLAAITFRRGPLHQTAAMTTGILTTRGGG